MKFKILKGTKTFDDLSALWKRMDKARLEAKKLAKSLGAENFATSGSHGIAGGIEGMEFPEKPEGWKSVGDSWQSLYMPKAIMSLTMGAKYTLPNSDIIEILESEYEELFKKIKKEPV